MARAASAPKKEISMEEALWKSADKLRGSVEPAEYKHVVLSLFFLKFASDKFEAQRKAISEKYGEKFVDNVAFYTKDNVFFLPEISRWSFIMENAKQDDIALKIDTALYTIEKANPALKGALPDNYYSRLHIDTAKLASLLDEIDKINTGDKENDIIGRVYEYFLSKFALAEGKGKGEFYTPKCIVNLIAEMIEPYDGILYDPCCGSGGMFVQSMKFVEAHHGNKKKVSIYGQEYTNTTYKLCKMNLAINKAAEKFLGLSINELENADFREMLPDVDWGQLQQWNQKGQYITNDTRLTTGKCIYDCSAVITPTLDANRRTFTVNLKQQEHLIASVNKVSGNRANYTFSSIYAQDPQMKKVVQLAQKYAHYDGAVLIEGESGTGKELFAQAIHNESSRAKGPFVAVNCASLPRDLIESELFGYEKGAFTGALREGNPGKFELANHGTLFLDEIGEMPLEFQAKLLRAVESLRIRRLGGTQERKLDLRVIAATNRNLRHEAEQGRFRQDLYYRLNVLKLDIPPLRERPLDIGFCAKAFLERFNQKYPEQRKEMSPDYLDALQQYDWPGNVRELQNSMERTFYACNTDVLTADDFRFVITGMTVSDKKENCGQKNKREEILAVLRSAEGRAEVAAQKLGISRATFYRMCKRYGIEPKKVK